MAAIEECKHVHDFNGTLAQCDFVQNNEHCNDTDGYFNYVEILYCDFGGTLAPLGGFQLLDLIITELKNHMTC
jgi:hypothetical protein